MNLITKIHVGLTFASFILLSSCSEDYIQLADHETATVRSVNGANSRGGVLEKPASIPITEGSTGQEVFPVGWSKNNSFNCNAGTSSFTHLWGDPLRPWIQPLNPPAIGAGSMVTFIASKNALNSEGGKKSYVATTIKNLVPGQKYAVKFLLASTALLLHGTPSQYAQSIDIEIPGTIGGTSAHTFVDLANSPATWVERTITFEAQDTETQVRIDISNSIEYFESHDQFVHYAHVYVGNNAVHKL